MIDGFIQAHATNYTKGRTAQVRYIVLHYTANDGDTAQNNCRYFAGANRKASAHFFVDENSIWRSVRDDDDAWHVGAAKYTHPICRNHNSIGIEMCSRKDANGNYYIKPETVANAVRLVRTLMDKYDVPVSRVLRHYDVTGKICPAPWVQDETQWRAFLEALEGDGEMLTYEQFKGYMSRYEAEIASQSPAWGKDKWDEATAKNIVDGGRPMSPMTRLEYAASELRRVEG